MTSKRIGGWIQWRNMQLLFKFQVNRMKIEDFRNTTLVVDLGPMLTFWSMLTSKIIGGWIQWPDMQILFKFQVNRMKIDNFRNLAYVDLLADVDLKNNWRVEFSDLKYKSSSNSKSIGWKLRILEISPKMLTFGLCWLFDLKNNRLLAYYKLYQVVKFPQDRFEIVTWRWLMYEQTDRQTE